MKGHCGLARLLAVASAMVALVVVGGATTGHAATQFRNELTPLIGTADVNEIPQVSYGGKIGYHLFIQNTGDSTTQHSTIKVISNLATFSDSDNTSCTVNAKDAHELDCNPSGGTLVPGAIFEANIRFTAPTTGPAEGEQVSTTASITIAAQTQKNGNPKGGTTLSQSAPVLTNVVENTAKADTYLHANENAATGKLSSTHTQNFSVTMPQTLLGNPFGVALSIHDNVGQICANCLNSYTSITIPTAHFPSTAGNPFYDATTPTPTVNPYGWSVSATYTGQSPSGLVHVDDDNVLHEVPSCADPSVGGAPSAVNPFCYATFEVFQGKKLAIASGHAIDNGLVGLH